jgi:hypothetical protein
LDMSKGIVAKGSSRAMTFCGMSCQHGGFPVREPCPECLLDGALTEL